MRKVWMLAISGPCAVNNPPEYLLKATMRPVVRFSAVGQVNVHPLLVGGLASIWCRVRGTLVETLRCCPRLQTLAVTLPFWCCVLCELLRFAPGLLKL